MRHQANYATAHDIARESGSSLSTVTKVLRGDGDRYGIRAETQTKIREVADALSYRPHVLAQSLRKGTSNFVAVVGSAGKFPIRAMRQHAAASELVSHGYRVHLYDFGWDTGRRRELLQEIESLRPMGLLVSELTTPETVEHVRQMAHRGLPVVGLDLLPDLDIDQVFIDRELAGYLPTRHLLELGHREIAYAISEGEGWYIRNRVQGFQRALKEEGVRFQERCLIRLPRRDSSQRAGYEIVTSGAVNFAKTTALMTLNDQVALGAFRSCFEKGIRIPEDLSLVGGEDLPEAEFFPVPLTTVRFPVDEVAKTAVALLLERSKGRTGKPEHIRVPPVLVIRKSSRRMKPD